MICELWGNVHQSLAPDLNYLVAIPQCNFIAGTIRDFSGRPVLVSSLTLTEIKKSIKDVNKRDA